MQILYKTKPDSIIKVIEIGSDRFTEFFNEEHYTILQVMELTNIPRSIIIEVIQNDPNKINDEPEIETLNL